jgi:3-hydroxyisobutyrate dehydrogenase-like beta-hydroxyacid dehydrogenase
VSPTCVSAGETDKAGGERHKETVLKRVGIVGLGDMGMAMASNVVAAGFELTGFDLRAERLDILSEMGARPADSPQAVGASSDAVFVMVLNGDQAREVVAGENGLLAGMATGATVIMSATIHPGEAREIGALVQAAGMSMIDTPVSGGRSGAESGTLTMMASTPPDVLEANMPVLKAVGEQIFHVGEEPGEGQTVKAALQAFIGASFAGIFEALVLGAKAGVSGQTLYDVFSASGVGGPLFRNCAKLIMDREFKGTGSHIGTMYKDLSISMQLGKDTGVPMFTTAAVFELFRAGMSKFPDEDNWSIVKLLEDIAGAKVEW